MSEAIAPAKSESPWPRADRVARGPDTEWNWQPDVRDYGANLAPCHFTPLR